MLSYLVTISVAYHLPKITTHRGRPLRSTSIGNIHGIRSSFCKITKNCDYLLLLQSVIQYAEISRFLPLLTS